MDCRAVSPNQPDCRGVVLGALLELMRARQLRHRVSSLILLPGHGLALHGLERGLALDLWHMVKQPLLELLHPLLVALAVVDSQMLASGGRWGGGGVETLGRDCVVKKRERGSRVVYKPLFGDEVDVANVKDLCAVAGNGFGLLRLVFAKAAKCWSKCDVFGAGFGIHNVAGEEAWGGG